MRKPKASSKQCCEYSKNKYGYVTGCGLRTVYNKYWRFCPYCGKSIVILFNSKEIEK